MPSSTPRPTRAAVRLTLVVVLSVAATACTGLSVSGGAGPAGAGTRVAAPRDAAGSSWTTFDQNGLRTGVDPSGASFSPATPAWTSPVFDGSLYGQPLLATGRVLSLIHI